MLLLITGLIIWTAAHLFRSLASDTRQKLQEKLGTASKGLMGVVILASLIMMIVGYRSVQPTWLWASPLWMIYLNNLLMVLALYIYFTTATKPGTAFVFGNLKNPQLTGFKIWAVAHLLVNGDVASLVLFGGLLVWAVLQVIVSNRSVSLVDRSTAPITSGWIHLLLVVVVFVVIAVVHTWAGRSPFA